MVKLYNLRKIYSRKDGNEVRALDCVSLEVSTGEFVSVQGPSGSGKTTLLLAAGGLLVPDEGTVSIEGANMYSMSGDDRARFRARTIGFVFQQFHLVPYLDIMDNILVPSLAHPNTEAKERAKELMEQFNLAHRTHHVPAELSTGERQRTALARALLNKPSLIFADEPTGNLDTKSSYEIMSLFQRLNQQGRTIVVVTHETDIAELTERIIRIADGRLIEDKRNPHPKSAGEELKSIPTEEEDNENR